MADTKLSQKIPTAITDPTGGYFHIIVPDGGNYLSKAIAASDIIVTSELVIDKLVNQSTSFTKSFDAGTKLENVDFGYVSGTPKIKIGTTLDGVEISLAELSVPNNDYLATNSIKIFPGTTTVYITITGGVVNVNFKYRTNYF